MRKYLVLALIPMLFAVMGCQKKAEAPMSAPSPAAEKAPAEAPPAEAPPAAGEAAPSGGEASPAASPGMP